MIAMVCALVGVFCLMLALFGAAVGVDLVTLALVFYGLALAAMNLPAVRVR